MVQSCDVHFTVEAPVQIDHSDSFREGCAVWILGQRMRFGSTICTSYIQLLYWWLTDFRLTYCRFATSNGE